MIKKLFPIRRKAPAEKPLYSRKEVPHMKLRKASPGDEAAVLELYGEASRFLAAQGIDQWQDGYPNREAFRRDLARGESWVLEEDGEVLATACLGFGREPTYDQIYQGAWAAEPEEYAFLHRIAVSGKLRGKNAPGLFFDRLEQDARRRGLNCLRGDTHRDNKIMQHVLEKNGLTYRGVIYLEDGGERLAFEKLL